MYEDSLSQEVWQTVLDNTGITKYPKKEIEKISGDLIDQYKSAAEFYGSDYETFIQDQMNTTVEDFEKQVDEAAKSSVKQTMVTEAIAEKEKRLNWTIRHINPNQSSWRRITDMQTLTN